MAKNVVIVESPAKARTLEKFLGKDFSVKACGGHVRDLPAKRLGVDVEKNFEPKYVVIKGKSKIIKALKEAVKKAKVVFLAPDPDREGEAIAWHLKFLLKSKNVKRIEFNEITKSAVLEAVKNPRDIDLKRVNAQQARRILDRLVGYKISPILWKKIRKGLSAGRVQSVTVRLIYDREKEIEAFKPKEYWSITASVSPKEKEEIFQAKLIEKAGKKIAIGNEKTAKSITNELEKAPFLVNKINRREQKRNPSPPFTTSTLQQEAARKLGFRARKTMMIAQQLYEGVEVTEEGSQGLITYMRTDSVRVAKTAQDEARRFIESEYGKNFYPKETRKFKKKKQAQDAHEAIRPTSSFRHPEKIKDSLTSDQFKLYSLIWSRFLASQMASAVLDLVSIDVGAGSYTFRATGSTVKFEGFMKAYIETKEEEREEEEESQMLPALQEGESLDLKELLPKQHFTQPPPRYTEASLVKELEQKGIGRPSTYAPILGTITNRGYVIREGRTLKPTELGVIVTEQLVKHFSTIMDIKFTAHMEDDLDDIVAGKMDWIDTLKEFYEPFSKTLERAAVEMEKLKKETMTSEICPKCGKNLIIRQGRYGDFMACSGFPKCRFTKSLQSEIDKHVKGHEICEKCGKPMTIKSGRFGSFLACTAYPKCKNIKPILKKVGVKCPNCDGELIERRSKKGRLFYGCSNWPKCKFATWSRPLPEKCPKCGSLLVEKKLKGKMVKKCSGKTCDYESDQA